MIYEFHLGQMTSRIVLKTKNGRHSWTAANVFLKQLAFSRSAGIITKQLTPCRTAFICMSNFHPCRAADLHAEQQNIFYPWKIFSFLLDSWYPYETAGNSLLRSWLTRLEKKQPVSFQSIWQHFLQQLIQYIYRTADILGEKLASFHNRWHHLFITAVIIFS